MSAARTSGRLLRLYPPPWRARYGEELETLIVETSDGGRVPWRVRADVALGGTRERLRAAGLGGGGAPGDRARGGALLVLCALAVFVLAGLVVQKTAEHWQDAVPAGSRGVPTAAFDVLVAGAAGAGVLVLAGIAAALPAIAAFLRAGGWPAIRSRVVAAACLTAAVVAATVALVVWAHELSGPERDGHDVAYALGFTAWALLGAACLLAWTAAAVAAARRLPLGPATLRLEARLAAAVAIAMAAMTGATAVWWAEAHVPGSSAPLALAVALMAAATLVGAGGARVAVRGARELPG